MRERERERKRGGREGKERERGSGVGERETERGKGRERVMKELYYCYNRHLLKGRIQIGPVTGDKLINICKGSH